MNPYMTFTQPWRSAFAVWTVMAQAQTEFALRAMGMTTFRTVARRSGPVPATASVSTPVALLEAPSVAEAAPEPVAEPAPSAEVVPLRLVIEASASTIAAATSPEARPEAEPEAAAFAPPEEPVEAPLAVLSETAQAKDLVQAAIQPLVAAEGGRDEGVTTAMDLLPGAAPAPSSARRTTSGARRGGKAKRTS